MTAADDLNFHLVAGAMYHRSWLTWFTVMHRLTMFVNLFLSGAAIAAIARGHPNFAIATSLAIGAATSLNLAFDFAGGARRHVAFRSTYHDLAAKLTEATDDSAVRDLKRQWIRASAEEGPEFEAVAADSRNGAIISLGCGREEILIIPKWHYILRFVWPFRGTKYETVAEKAARMRADAT